MERIRRLNKDVMVGIDSGLTGAVAFIGMKDKEIMVFNTPTVCVKTGRKYKNIYVIPSMVNILRQLDGNNFKHVFIEKVHSMPGQGAPSTFSQGMGYGIWLGILASLKIPYTEVTPQSWKKELLFGMKNKDDARIRVTQLFPAYSFLVQRKKDIDRAEAILIAEYGRRNYLR